MYGEGLGVPQDYTESVRWYGRAAEQGHAEAQFSLGVKYYGGVGVPQDYSGALEWYRRAAEQGHDLIDAALTIRSRNVMINHGTQISGGRDHWQNVSFWEASISGRHRALPGFVWMRGLEVAA